MKTIDVIIPTYKPGKEFDELLNLLSRQSVMIRTIRVINTGEEFFGDHPNMPNNVLLEHIPKDAFDHAGTRNRGGRASDADLILFMTQDAIPADRKLVEKLMLALEEPGVSSAYARQLPKKNCPKIETYTRSFNYPDKSRVKSISDLSELGIKTFFCSDVCACYDRRIWDSLGGFEEPAIFNEDMIFACRQLRAGYRIAYTAEAKVYHSHRYSAKEQYRRNFDLAVSQTDHPEVFEGIPSEGEGIRMVRQTAAWLCKTWRPYLLFSLVWQSGWKYLGYRAGKRYRSMSRAQILRRTSNPGYWNLIWKKNRETEE